MASFLSRGHLGKHIKNDYDLRIIDIF